MLSRVLTYVVFVFSRGYSFLRLMRIFAANFLFLFCGFLRLMVIHLLSATSRLIVSGLQFRLAKQPRELVVPL